MRGGLHLRLKDEAPLERALEPLIEHGLSTARAIGRFFRSESAGRRERERGERPERTSTAGKDREAARPLEGRFSGSRMICAITCNDALPPATHHPLARTLGPSLSLASTGPSIAVVRDPRVWVQGRDNGRSLSARYWPIVAGEREPERPYRVRRGVIPGTPQGDSSFFNRVHRVHIRERSAQSALGAAR